MQSNRSLVSQVTTPHCRVTGFGLVEIMIGVALGLVLLLALYSLLASNRQTYSTVQSTTSIMADGQQISQLFNTLLQQTGFRNYERLKLNQALPAGTSELGKIKVSWKEGQSVFITNDVTGNASIKDGTDVLQIRFTGSRNKDSIPATVLAKMDATKTPPDDADGTIINCSGTGVAATPVTMVFYIDTSNRLICSDSLDNTVEIASDVESLKTRVRERGADKEYQQASGTTDWTKVGNLEVAFLLAKPFDGSVKRVLNTIKVLDKEVKIADGANKLHQVFSNNLMIRNQP